MSKANRTKGNAKASSSRKAAEALQNSSGLLLHPSQIGFGFSEEETFVDLDPNYRTILRKLSKKDSLTRLKGLEELHSCIEKDDLKMVSTALDCWPRLYSKLALDGNFKIRCCSHKIMFKFCDRLGKSVSKSLSQTLPVWYLGCADRYPDVAKMAHTGFCTTFPDQKFSAALTKFSSQICELCCNIMRSDGSYMLLNTEKGEECEELSQRKIRLWCCALNTLAALANSVPSENMFPNLNIITENSFWKNLFSSDSILLKRALLNLTASLITNDCTEMKQYAKGFMMPIVNLIEYKNENGIARDVCHCLLVILDKYKQETWTMCNLEKVFLPKFVSNVKNAGWGSAGCVAPLCMQIISTTDVDVARKIVNATFVGACKVVRDKNEVCSLIRAASDCILLSIKGDKFDWEWIFEEVEIFLEKMLESKCCSEVLCEFRALLSVLLECCRNKENLSVAVEKLEQTQVDIVTKIISGQDGNGVKIDAEYARNLGSFYVAQFLESATTAKIGQQIIEKCLVLFDQSGLSLNILSFLCGIMDKQVSASEIHAKTLSSLLTQLSRDQNVELQRMMVEGLFKGCSVLTTEQDRVQYLHVIAQACQNSASKTAVFLCELHEWIGSDDYVTNFVQSDTFGAMWLSLDFTDNSVPMVKDAFQYWLTTDVNNELCLPASLIDATLERLLHVLEQQCSNNCSRLDSVIQLLSQSALVIIKAQSACNEPTERLILQALNIHVCRMENGISEECLEAIEKLWKGGLQMFLEKEESKLLIKMMKIVVEDVKKADTLAQYELVQGLGSQMFGLVTSVAGVLIPDLIYHGLLQSKEEWCRLEKLLGNKHEFLWSLDTNSCLFPLESKRKQTKDVSFITTAVFTAQMLSRYANSDGHFIGRKLEAFQRFGQAAAVLETCQVQNKGPLKALMLYLNNCIPGIVDRLGSSITAENKIELTAAAADDSFLEAKGLQFLLANFAKIRFDVSGNDSFISAVLLRDKTAVQRLDIEQIEFGSRLQLLNFDSDRLAEYFVKEKQNIEQKAFLCCNIQEMSMARMHENLCILGSLRTLVEFGILKKNEELKDFVFCILVASLQSCSESVESCDQWLPFYIYLNHCLLLYSACSTAVQNVGESTDLGDLCQEWNEFFVDACSSTLVPIFYHLAIISGVQTCNEDYLRTHFVDRCVKLMCPVFCGFNEGQIVNKGFKELVDPELELKGYDIALQSALLHLCPLLESLSSPVQIAAYHLIDKILPSAVELELKCTDTSDTSIDKGEDDQRKPPSYLLEPLNRCYDQISQNIIEQNLELSADCCMLPPLSGYVLCWNLLLTRFYSAVASDSRPSYCLYLKHSKLLENLILTLFCVLPNNLKTYEGLYGHKTDLWNIIFEQQPCDRVMLELDLERVCLYLYSLTLQLFPAAVRTWYRAQNKNLASHIERFTTLFVSPFLCKKELKSAAAYPNTKNDNMTVSTRPAAGEVVAVYKMDDMNMELLVNVPGNYPLCQPTVSAAKRVGVSIDTWRKWMLQMTAFLQNQNGSLLDGILLWKRNVDEHLAGIEDCPICFMAVHSTNYQLPKVTCRQCNKKFHASCLLVTRDSWNGKSTLDILLGEEKENVTTQKGRRCNGALYSDVFAFKHCEFLQAFTVKDVSVQDLQRNLPHQISVIDHCCIILG